MKRTVGEVRRAQRIRQTDAAARLGIAQSTWSRYERAEGHAGRRKFTKTTMLKVLLDIVREAGTGLQIDVEDIIGKPKRRGKRVVSQFEFRKIRCLLGLFAVRAILAA